jgi:long-chain acyl-CoA synthetase
MPLSGPPLDAPVNMPEVLKRGLETKPDDDALISRRQRWSWRRLDDASTRLAANYLDLGLEPGDRVASLMPNRTELFVHYIACMKCGLVAMPLNYRYMAPEIDYALSVGEPKILLAHDERADDLAKSKLLGTLPLGRISYDDNGGTGPLRFGTLVETANGRRFDPPKPDDPAIIFFTSGSTGKPKGVCHSFETLGWVIASTIESFEVGPDDVMMPAASASHAGGHWFSLMAFAAGGRVLTARTFDADEILPLMRAERPTVMWMLPSALYALVHDHGARHEDFTSVKLCFSGGDKVSDALEEEFTTLAGVAIDEEYGMTEIGIATVNPPEAPRPGAVGAIAPGYELCVRDKDGREAAAGTDGRLWCKFPGNMIRYWNNPKATADTIVDGWLDTGDVMSVDADGFIWFHGRQKQIIVHDGSNISPQEIEGVLLEHDAVESAGVVGVHDPIHGENVRAYVTLTPGAARPPMQELIRFARERVGYKAPEEIVVLDEMPLNATGKVDRVTLKKWAAETSGASVGAGHL